MSDNTSIERPRLTALEAAVADLHRQLAARSPTNNWIEKIIGTFKDDPDFEKMVEYGREFRNADRPPEDEEP